MGLSWGALAGSFLAPFLYSLYWRGVTKTACAVNFCWGSGLMLLNMFFKSSFPAILQSSINCGAFAMLSSLIIVPLVSRITRKPEAQRLDAIFDCYQRRVTVPVTEVLGNGGDE
jgi:Na+/proline symporter